MSVKQLPSHWKVVKLGNEKIATTSSGGTPERSKTEYFSGNIRWVKSGELDDNWIYDTEEKITQQGLEKSSAKIFPAGTLLLALYGATAGKTAILGVEAATNQAVCAIFPVNESFDSQFIQFYLICIRSQILRARTGGAQPNISQRVIKLLDIILPPLPEQRAIAHTLRTIQKAKEARQRELELERERKATLMQYLFTHGTRNEPTKQTAIGEIPQSWKVVNFGEVCESSAYGPRFSGSLYSPSGNVATLRTTDMDKEGNINYLTMPFATLDIDKFKNHFLKEKDFLITRSGTCGIASIFESFDQPVLPGAFLIRFRLSQEVDPHFLQYYINSPKGKIRILQLAAGAVQQNISGTSLRNFAVPLPPLSEQLEIAKVLRTCDTKITALQEEISTLDELFRAMLSELMTGQLSALPLIQQEN